LSEVQNKQPDGQQQAQDAAGHTVKGVHDAVGGPTGNQEQDGEQGNEGALGGMTDQAQDVAGQATDQAGQVVGQASDVVGGLIGGGLGNGQGAGQPGEQEMDDYSYSDTDAATVENDKTPKGILGQLLNLDILPPPQSDTITLESDDSAGYEGPAEAQQQGAQG
jgi:hypothetical protein